MLVRTIKIIDDDAGTILRGTVFPQPNGRAAVAVAGFLDVDEAQVEIIETGAKVTLAQYMVAKGAPRRED